jgi:predicted MPP superfamily phosphohydrolase
MFWFWFWLVVDLIALGVDVALWTAAMRLTKRTPWRVLASVFMAGHMVAVYSLMCGFDWPRYTPKPALVAVASWHYFALGLGLAVLLPLGFIRVCAWIARRLRRRAAPVHPPLVAPPPSASGLRRREFIGACAALAPPLLTLGMTGISLAQLNSFRVRRFVLSIPTLPRALDGVTLAHVTDTHLGEMMRGRVLRDLVDTTNSLRPDLVVFTGDLIDYDLADLSEGIAMLKAMEARYGLWMVEGNHDVAQDGGEFERRVKAAGLPLLVDASAVVDVRGYPVQLLGLGWIGEAPQGGPVTDRQMRLLMNQRRPEAFPLLLAHHPHVFDAAAKAGLPLTLAGHTHGGQCMLDRRHGLGSVLFRYWSGLYTRGPSQMIVSNGVGSWLPLRINAPAEIVHLTLRCGQA